MDTRIVFLRFRERRPPVQFGPDPKPFSLRLQELADELQDKLTEWDFLLASPRWSLCWCVVGLDC